MTDNADDKNNTHDEFYLLKTIPDVLRARGFRLYLEGGQRLVDLWLNGGAAALGHTPANLLREIKNTASRGLYAPLPHFTEKRFIKALSKLLPGFNFRVYAAPPRELIELFLKGNPQRGTKDYSAKLWRPFTDPLNPFLSDCASLIIPIIPGIQTWRGGLPYGLCVAAFKHGGQGTPVKTDSVEINKLIKILPPSDILPPVLLAAATRGIYDLLASPERAKPKLPRVLKTLENSRWTRSGIYLHLKEKPASDEWEKLFNKFLEAGFLPPPSPEFPLILPGEMSDGEEAKLATAL